MEEKKNRQNLCIGWPQLDIGLFSGQGWQLEKSLDVLKVESAVNELCTCITPLSSTWLPNYSQYCHDTFLSSPLSRDPSFAQKTNECGERHTAVVFRQISRTGAVNTRTPQDLFWTWSSVDCWRRGIRRTRVEWKEGKSAQCAEEWQISVWGSYSKCQFKRTTIDRPEYMVYFTKYK